MTWASWHRELISAPRPSVLAGALRGALRLAEFPYRWAVGRRNRAFDLGRRPVFPVDARVISVGNLTVGGTGKTPFVAWLCRWFLERNVRVAIVSRGYGTRPGVANDEARELALALPSVPHIQNPDRVAAARQAIVEHKAQVIVADDAFQHRRLRRDLDIVLLDALQPFGFDHLLPRGLLREPPESLTRAAVVALSRSDLLEESGRALVRRRVAELAPRAAWLEVVHRPDCLMNAMGERRPLEDLTSGSWAAFCGLGNPTGFRQTLQTAGANVRGWREFPDHFDYSEAVCDELGSWGREQSNAKGLLCTGKDLVKIGKNSLGGLPLWALKIELSVALGEAELTRRLQELLNN